jgi:hypothetical protein
MSAIRFSTQIDSFLQAALRYGVSSLGNAEMAIRLESSTRLESDPEGYLPPKPAVQAALSSRDKPDRQRLVSLGVCGFDYRLVLLFQIEDDASTRAFFGGEAIQDGLSEFTNLVCGSLNRSLQQAYPSTGMSTPFTMSGTCFDHLRVLRPDLRSTLSFMLGADVRLRIAYALSVGRTFGFVDSAPVEETIGMGELELF